MCSDGFLHGSYQEVELGFRQTPASHVQLEVFAKDDACPRALLRPAPNLRPGLTAVEPFADAFERHARFLKLADANETRQVRLAVVLAAAKPRRGWQEPPLHVVAHRPPRHARSLGEIVRAVDGSRVAHQMNVTLQFDTDKCLI